MSNNSNEQFQGFCIDLLKAIADMLNFQYELYEVPDGKYGAENTSTGEWNGLVREIIDKVSGKTSPHTIVSPHFLYSKVGKQPNTAGHTPHTPYIFTLSVWQSASVLIHIY